jgi:hypothetical protein
MALVVSDKPAFDFWHGSSGNQIFSTLGILAFGVLANYLINKPAPNLEES